MDTKPFWARKTNYAGIASVLTGIGEMVAAGGVTATGIQAVIAGLGLIFLRSSVANGG